MSDKVKMIADQEYQSILHPELQSNPTLQKQKIGSAEKSTLPKLYRMRHRGF